MALAHLDFSSAIVTRAYFSKALRWRNFKKRNSPCNNLRLGKSDEFELKFLELRQAKLKGPRAELGHFNFWAETEVTVLERIYNPIMAMRFSAMFTFQLDSCQ